MYGVLERQFRRYFAEAETPQGQHRRQPAACCWNRVWTTSCTAWASRSTRAEARQLVSHKACHRQRPSREHPVLPGQGR